LLRVIGRGAYGEIWMARTVTGAFRAVKVVYRSTFESERAFLREFEGCQRSSPFLARMPALSTSCTSDVLPSISITAWSWRTIIGRAQDRYWQLRTATLKTDLSRHKRLSADESIQLGLSLTEALEALHKRGLTHRDIKPSNIIFSESMPKLADIGLVAASGQRSFVGTEGYIPPEGPGTRAPTSIVWANFFTKPAPEKIGLIFQRSIRN